MNNKLLEFLVLIVTAFSLSTLVPEDTSLWLRLPLFFTLGWFWGDLWKWAASKLRGEA